MRPRRRNIHAIIPSYVSFSFFITFLFLLTSFLEIHIWLLVILILAPSIRQFVRKAP